MTSLPDPSRIPDSAWEFEGLSQDGLRRHYVHWIDREKGLGFRKTENIVEDELLALNQESLNDSQGSGSATIRSAPALRARRLIFSIATLPPV
jgi:hypothetical protein